MATVKTVKGKKITLGSNVSGISDYALEVLADLLQASGNTKCTITSGARDAYNQARVMYDNLISTKQHTNKAGKKVGAVQYWKEVYGKSGDEVIDVFVKEKKAGKTKSQIIEAMRVKAQANFDAGRTPSRHMTDFSKLQVMDVGKSTIAKKSAFVKAINQSKAYYKKKDSKGKVSHYINETYAYHIEIPVPDASQQTTDATTDIPSQSPEQTEQTTTTKIVKYIHPADDNRRTLDELLKDKSFIGYDIPYATLIEFEYNGTTNNEKMWEALDLGSKKLFGENEDGSYNPNVLYPVVGGTILYIPVTEVTVGSKSNTNADLWNAGAGIGNEGIVAESGNSHNDDGGSETSQGSSPIVNYTSNITIQKTKEPTLYPSALKRLSSDPGYVPTYNSRGLQSKDIYPQLSVKAFSKVLDRQGWGYIDLTCDIIRCDISSRMAGGDFTIELKPKVGWLNGLGDDNVTNETIWLPKGEVKTADGQCVDVHNINREKLFTDSRTPKGFIGSEYRRNMMYYNAILQQNDMLWIKFERLGIEDDDTLKQNQFGEWYDMIGLIDVVEVPTNAATTDSRVIIRGRDLTKVLQDDNSYFNPYSIGHASSVYGDNPFANGRYANGGFMEISAIQARSIQQAIEFIFHRVASIGYVPDYVFKLLQDKTVTTIQKIVKGKDGERIVEDEEKDVKGAWQCVKLFIDESIKDLVLIDDSISNPDGSILDIMNKICQDPFVEFFTDTYGDKFYMIARKPPFEHKVVREIVKQATTIDETDGEVFGGARSGPRTNAYKAFLDEREKKRIEENKGFVDNSEGELEQITVIDRQYPLIINVGEEDVLTDNLSFSNESYSWFQVTDRGNFAGASITLGHIPALYFDDMAQLFGNRRLDVTSNYSNYKFFQSKKSEQEADLYAEQAAQHLAFLVETNIHLPFTRRGSITLNGGDRRIKKGNYIYYRPTQEIFYVTGVHHGIGITTGGIDRTTKIDVERGMVMAYVKGSYEPIKQEDGSYKDVEVSYFNIVDIPKLEDGVRDAVSNGSANDKFDYKANITVNKDILNFFVERRQFKQYD